MNFKDNIAPDKDPAGRLAEFVADLRYEDIPEEHVDYVKKDLLDEIGCMIAGSTGPTIKELIEHVREYEGECKKGGRIVVYGDRVSQPSAAFANGTIARACDLGDTHNEGGHIAEWVVPAMVTGIEMSEERISGKDLITAFVAGAEWGSREQMTFHLQYHCNVSPGERGGASYATASLAKLLGLNKEQIWAAQGMSYGARPQSEQQKYNEGSPMVRLQHGFVVEDSFHSVDLARKNVPAIKGIYMGEGGLLKNIIHGDIMDPDFLTEDLGKRWVWREQVTMKPYAGCKYNHTPIYGTLKLMKKENFTWRDIESAHYTVSAGAIVTIAPAEVKWNPQTSAEALFSNPYSVAYALINGDCFLDAYEAETVKANMINPEFTELMGRLHYDQDLTLPVFDDYPIEIVLKDGRKFSFIERELAGNIINPMSWEEVERKFMNCTKYSAVDLGEERYRKIIDFCKNLENMDDVKPLLDALCGE